LKVFNL